MLDIIPSMSGNEQHRGNGTVPAPSQCAINTPALISYGREGDNLGIVLNGSKGSRSEAVARRQHGGMRSYNLHLF